MNAPNPAELAAQAARRSAEPGDPADHPVRGEIDALLDEVAMIRDVVGDEFDLGAVTRQAELLTRAHDTLAVALEDVGRG